MLTRALLIAFVLISACRVQDAPVGPTGQIAYNRGGQIMLIDAATRKETVLVADNTYDRPLYWMPGGERLIYWNHDGGAWDLWAIDPDTKVSSASWEAPIRVNP